MLSIDTIFNGSTISSLISIKLLVFTAAEPSCVSSLIKILLFFCDANAK